MNNKTLVIVDAGHGGIDSGAVGNNLEEKNLTLRAATYIFNRLQELGIPAVMTRTDDEYLPKSERIKRIQNLYNNDPNTIIVSNHINAGGSIGAEVVYSLKSDGMLANMILDSIEESGQTKRKAYQRRLPENPSKDYYYIIRETSPAEAVLVEYGFIDNKKDAENLNNNIEQLAEGTVKALAQYLGVNYTPPQGTNKNTYTVKKGDTLYSISKEFNIPMVTLTNLNNLTSSQLTVGQTLILNEDSIDNTNNNIGPNTNTYQVKRGDTLYSIALKYNTTIDELKKINNLSTNLLAINQTLKIPTKKEETYTNYHVKKGDSLWSISRKFNIPVNKLIEINSLEDLNIKENQSLLVPEIKENTNDNIYIVKSGDTLWSISSKFNIPVVTLKELNNLTSNLLTIGQQLIIKEH